MMMMFLSYCLGKKLLETKDSLTDLLRTMSSCTEFEVLLQQAVKREAEAAAKLEKVMICFYSLCIYDFVAIV